MMTKQTRFSAEFEGALAQRAEQAPSIVTSDVETLTKAELIAAGIEQGTVNGQSADSFLIAAGRHVPTGDTTTAGVNAAVPFSKTDIHGQRQPQVGGNHDPDGRKTPQDRKDIETRQHLIVDAITLSNDLN